MSGIRRFTTVGGRGIVASLVLVATGALFTTVAYASWNGHDFDLDHDAASASGHVSLRVNAASSTTCHIANLVPGDSPTPTPCRFSVTYTGTVPAYVALNVMVDSTSSRTGHALYDSGRADGITFVISDGHHTFSSPRTPGQSGGSCPRGRTCWSVANELAAWYQGSNANLIFNHDSAPVTWTETVLVPKSLSNEFQGASANLVLTAQAVQVSSNPLPTSCSAVTIGLPCTPTNHFTWN